MRWNKLVVGIRRSLHGVGGSAAGITSVECRGWWCWWKGWRLRLVVEGEEEKTYRGERTLWWLLLMWGGQLAARGGDGGGLVGGESVSGWRSGWREREKREDRDGNKIGGLIFYRLWTLFSPLSSHEIHPYL